MTFVGVGIGIGFSGLRAASAFTPASLGPKWWAVPLDDGQFTYGTPPAVAEVAPSTGSTLTGSFTNSTPAEQPADVSGWLDFDGSADDLAYDGAKADYKFLYYSAANPGNYPSFTVVIPFKLDALTGNRALLYQGTPGLRIYAGADGRIFASTWNATAPLASAAAPYGTVAAGVASILMLVSDGSSLKLYIDGVEVASDLSFANTPSSADSSADLVLGSYGLSLFFNGTLIPPLFLDYAADADQRADLWTYYSEALSIPLATDTLDDAELLTWSGLKLWLAPNVSADVTREADPAFSPEDFSGGIGSWTAYNTGSVDIESTDPYDGNYLRCTTGGSSYGARHGGLIQHNRYKVDSVVRASSGITLRTPGTADGDFAVGTSWAAYSTEGTANVSTFHFINAAGAAGSPFDVDNIVVTNLSFSAIADHAGVSSDFAQATAAKMPWIDSTTGAMRLDLTDGLPSSAPSEFRWHFYNADTTDNRPLLTCFYLVRVPSFSTNHYLRYTRNVGGSGGVCHIIFNSSGEMVFQIYNGAAWMVTSNTLGGYALSADTPTIVAYRSDAVNAQCYSAGSVRDTTAFTGGVVGSSGNPDESGMASRIATGDGLGGYVYVAIEFDRALSGTEVYRLGKYIESNYGGTW